MARPRFSTTLLGRARVPESILGAILGVVMPRVLDEDLTWESQRRRLTRLSKGFPTTGIEESRIEIGGVQCVVVAPTGKPIRGAVVHIHGGGYCVGSPNTAVAWASRLAKAAEVTVYLPDYRLAPEHPWPSAQLDVAKIFERVVSEYGPDRTILSGDSAGAGLALARVQSLIARSAAMPAGLLLISPWLDLTADRTDASMGRRRDPVLSSSWLARCVEAYCVGVDPSDPSVSPIFGDLSSLPPVLVQVGSADLLLSDSDRLVSRLRSQGRSVSYLRAPGLWHDFVLQAGLVRSSDKAVGSASRWIAMQFEGT